MRFIGGLIALVLLLIAIAVMAATLVPASAYRERLETAASEAVGREVALGDDLDFRIWPRIGFHVSDLTVANAEGFTAEALARIAEADFGVDLLALARGEVAIERFVLTRPEIQLERRADGLENWTLTPETATPAEAQADGAAAARVRDVRLGDVRIIGGRVLFTDAAADQRFEASDLDAVARLDGLATPFEAEGTMIFQGAPATFDVVVTTLAALRAGEEANVKLELTAGQSRVGADVAVRPGVEGASKLGPTFEGPVSLTAPDLPELAALLGAPMEDAPGFDRLSIAGHATGSSGGATLKDAKLGLDAIDATGELTVRLDGARPKATGALRTGDLDLRPYLPPQGATAAGFPAWSDAKLNLRSLRNIDAALELAAERILLNGVETGKSRLAVTIDGGRLTADLPQLQIYEGGGSGRVIVDASRATPAIEGYFDLRAVQAQPLTLDLLNSDRLLGVGAFRMEFAARGDSQAAIMSSLDGEGGFDLADGALKGINIAKLVGSVRDLAGGGKISPTAIASVVSAARSPNEETDFTEFLSAFAIEDGLMRAPTISLTGPFLKMTGSGVINLPAQTLDIRLAPTVTSTMDGAAGRTFTAPVRVTGGFGAPQIGVDAEALIAGEVGQRGRQFIERALGLGEAQPPGGAEAGQPEAASEPEAVARGILRGILGGAVRKPEAQSDDASDAPSEPETADPEAGDGPQ